MLIKEHNLSICSDDKGLHNAIVIDVIQKGACVKRRIGKAVRPPWHMLSIYAGQHLNVLCKCRDDNLLIPISVQICYHGRGVYRRLYFRRPSEVHVEAALIRIGPDVTFLRIIFHEKFRRILAENYFLERQRVSAQKFI
eukprot:CAMPEP_0184660304 /NCGR_PEP_ID=MMETSP0308-20130426/33419_1 /TAXON_ID=38269 /ORGANISM="Gloeochaete witrockiana, Strain SAG 46.84" /LENGTH=138 /DNA_ID=CAMNT_0027100797 /DNA_START=384 /DNA_END=797 /DNA_ORIENTATION=-